MSQIRRFITTAALALCAALPTAAMAQTPTAEVLLLATGETRSNYKNSITNLKTALENHAPSGLVDFEGTLDTADISSNLSQYKTIVVATGAKYITDTNLQTLATQIKGNPDQAFIIFSDSADSADKGGILSKFTDMLSAVDATGLPLVVSSAQDGANETIALNTASGYSGYFSKLANFKADHYRTIAGAPEDNVLYRATSKDAHAIFVPQTQMNGGNGACTFLASDLTIFTGANSATKHKDIAKTLLDNVKPGSDACRANPPSALPTVLYLSTAEQYASGTNPCKDSYATDKERYEARDQGKRYRNDNAKNGGRNFIRNARKFFSDRVGTSHFINRAGALSTADQIALAKGDSEGVFTDDTTDWSKVANDFAQLGAGDVVVVQTAYQLMDNSEKFTVNGEELTKAGFIAKQIKENKELTFILLLDTCNDCSFDSKTCTVAKSTANLDAIMVPAINDALGWEVTSANLSDAVNWTTFLDAHSRSAYASSITTLLPTLAGGKAGVMGNTSGSLQCVPQQNVLFPAPTRATTSTNLPTGYQYAGNGYETGWYCDQLPSGSTDYSVYQSPNCDFTKTSLDTWPELNASSSFGMLIPFWQSNHNQGACIYLGQDNNVFDNGRCTEGKDSYGNPVGVQQCDELVAMFMSLPTGACAIPQQQAIANAGGLGSCTSSRCMLAEAGPKPDGISQQDFDATLAVVGTMDANGNEVCKAKVWCNPDPSTRKDYCGTGEDPATHCCKATPICTEGQAISTGCTCQSPMVAQNGVCISSTPACKPPTGCSGPSAPTTDWPALLGLSALLPLLAARRRQRK